MRDEILNSPLKVQKIVWIHNDLSQVKGYTNDEIRKFFDFDKIMVISKKSKRFFSIWLKMKRKNKSSKDLQSFRYGRNSPKQTFQLLTIKFDRILLPLFQ
jgi:(p)ppGpp synthase/HD superfamily hydrolase